MPDGEERSVEDKSEHGNEMDRMEIMTKEVIWYVYSLSFVTNVNINEVISKMHWVRN